MTRRPRDEPERPVSDRSPTYAGASTADGVAPKRLERGRFVWPSPADGTLAISAAQLAYMLDGIDWRNPRHTFRPQRAG